MSDEVKVTASLEIINDTFRLEKTGRTTLTFDQTTKGGGVPGTITIPAADTVVDLSDLGTEGWLWMKNLDATNYVSWGPDNGSSAIAKVGRLEAGEPALFRLEPGLTLRMQANVAPCQVQILACED